MQRAVVNILTFDMCAQVGPLCFQARQSVVFTYQEQALAQSRAIVSADPSLLRNA